MPPAANVTASANPLLPRVRNGMVLPRSQDASCGTESGALRQSPIFSFDGSGVIIYELVVLHVKTELGGGGSISPELNKVIWSI